MKKITGILSVLLCLLLLAGTAPAVNIFGFGEADAAETRMVNKDGEEGFDLLRKYLEDNTTRKIVLICSVKYQTEWGGGDTAFKPIRITSEKVLDLKGHSIVLDNVTNATRNKIVAGQYYSANTTAAGSDASMFEIDDNGFGSSVGKLTVMNSGSVTDSDSPRPDKYVTIQHTGFPVGNPEDYYSKHYRNYCVRNVFDVINGSLILDGGFAVMAGQTKEQAAGGKAEAVKNAVSSSIGFALNVADTVAKIAAGGEGAAASAAGGNANTVASNPAAQQQAQQAAPAQANLSGAPVGGASQGGKKDGKQGNTITGSLAALGGQQQTVPNFIDALYAACKKLDNCTQSIWGTCVNVGSNAAVTINGGKFYSHGQSDTDRESVIAGAAGSVITINDGEFHGVAGADVLHVDVNSNTRIMSGRFDCSYESSVRLIDSDNKTCVYPGTIGATGISTDMFDQGIIADGRMMIKAKVLPTAALDTERANISALSEGANQSAAQKITSQANHIKSKVLVRNGTSGKYELMSSVCLPLSSWVEVSPNYGLTTGCRHSLFMQTPGGQTGVINYIRNNDTVLQIFGTDYFSNSLLQGDPGLDITKRSTSGNVMSEEINPVSGEPYKTVYSVTESANVHSVKLSECCPEAGKTYKVTYYRIDAITTKTGELYDIASTSVLVKVKSDRSDYIDKLSFDRLPVSGETATVNLDSVDLNRTVKGAKVFNCTYTWYKNGSKLASSTTSNGYRFLASDYNADVYCSVNVDLNGAAARELYPNFKPFTARTDVVKVAASDTVPVICKQPQNITSDEYYSHFLVYTDVLVNSGSEFYSYKWEYSEDGKNWKKISQLDSGAKSAIKLYASENNPYGNSYFTGDGSHEGTDTGNEGKTAMNRYTFGYYRIAVEFTVPQRGKTYFVRCLIGNRLNNYIYTENAKVSLNHFVTFGGENLIKSENKSVPAGVSFDLSTNTLNLNNVSADEKNPVKPGLFGISNSSKNEALITTDIDTLTVNLTGDNVICITGPDERGSAESGEYFIFSDKKIVFTGSGSLTVKFINYREHFNLIEAKEAVFDCSGKISFNLYDDYGQKDKGEYYMTIPVCADSVTLNRGTVEFMTEKKTEGNSVVKLSNVFVKNYAGSEYSVSVEATAPGKIEKAYLTSLKTGALQTGEKAVLFCGANRAKASKAAEGETAINGVLCSEGAFFDYVRIGIMSDDEIRLDNGCQHEPGDPEITVIKEATCTQSGTSETVIKCKKCKIELSKTVFAVSAAHAPDAGAVTTDPTCKSEGVKSYKCIYCNNVIKTEKTAKTTVHTWNGGTVTTPSTAKTEGVITYKCTVCGAERTESVAKLAYILGNLNPDKDSEITVEDARLALRLAVKLDTPTGIQELAGDVDGKNGITVEDARLILRVAVKLETKEMFPAAKK